MSNIPKSIHRPCSSHRLRNILVFTCLFATFAFVLGCGCSRSDIKPREGAGGDTSVDSTKRPPRNSPEYYGHLSRLRSITHRELQEELSRIEEEGGTPLQLTKVAPHNEITLARELQTYFPVEKPDSSQAVESPLRKTSAALIPDGEFVYKEPEKLASALEFLAEHDSKRTAIRDSLKTPLSGFEMYHTAGLGADFAIVDVLWVCCNLEAIEAAKQLYVDKKPSAAIDAVDVILQFASRLDDERFLLTRLEAAYMRSLALKIVIATLNSDLATPADFQRVSVITQTQLAEWPNERDVWIGERAVGLHTYEIARELELAELFLPEEIERLTSLPATKDLRHHIRVTINRDQEFYLESMRKLIDRAAESFAERRIDFAQLNADLRAKGGMLLVASEILLPGIENACALIAEDRANWEALALALAVSLGKPLPPHMINPRTGDRYDITKYPTSVLVNDIAPAGVDYISFVGIPIVTRGLPVTVPPSESDGDGESGSSTLDVIPDRPSSR